MGSLLNMSGGSLLNKGLPYDKEIEYLQSTGTQWIDTLISASPTIGVKGRVMLTQYTGTGNNICLGCSDNGVFSGGKGFGYDLKNSDHHWAYVGGQLTKLQGYASLNNWYDFSMNYLNNGVCVDFSGTVNLTKGNDSTNLHIALFGFLLGNRTISGYSMRSGKFGKVQFTDGSNIVRDFIPVRIGQIGYMYDKVSKQLFGNSGTGDFILGNDI